MGVNTKGVLASPVKDVYAVSLLIERIWNKLMLDVKRMEFPKNAANRLSAEWYSENARLSYAHTSLRLVPDSECVYVETRIRGYDRTMAVMFSCDSDNNALAPKSVSLSLSCFGFSDILIKAALYSLSLFGPVYYSRSDSDDNEPVLLADAPLTFRTAITQNLVTPYQFEKWVERFDETGLLFGIPRKSESFESIFCISKEALAAILKIEDTSQRWDALRAAMHCEMPTPSFWPTQLSDMGDTNPEVFKEPALSDEVIF